MLINGVNKGETLVSIATFLLHKGVDSDILWSMTPDGSTQAPPLLGLARNWAESGTAKIVSGRLRPSLFTVGVGSDKLLLNIYFTRKHKSVLIIINLFSPAGKGDWYICVKERYDTLLQASHRGGQPSLRLKLWVSVSLFFFFFFYIMAVTYAIIL